MALSVHDIVSAMRADPPLAEGMRAVILDEELRSVPVRLARLKEGQAPAAA